MAGYVDLGTVRTWYDATGSGEPLLLLHPGLADARAFEPNLPALAAHFRVLTPERRGHGHSPDVAGPFTFEQMADDTARFIERMVSTPVRLAGCSDGAIVALLVALTRPDLVERLVCVAGPFHRDGWIPEAIDPNNRPPAFMARSYAEVSPDGIDHFPVVVDKLARAHIDGPTVTVEDLGRLDCRTLVMIADDDEVALEHAIAFYRALRHGELAVLPGTSHGLLVEKPLLSNAVLLDFLTGEPAPTYAPIRRRPA